MKSVTSPKTMIVSVPIMSQDVSLTDEPDIGRWMSLADWFVMKGEEPYFDGPVSRRVAVVDLDPDSGMLRPGARLVDSRPRGETSSFAVEEGERDEWGVGEIARIESDAFMQASVFGTVIKTVQMFERAPMLARPIRWAFGDEQLLVVPRAGEMANAFYDRDTHSLQFFSARPSDPNAKPIHTALSHDVVAHETAHAVLDGICPDLYDAITPQARALHESFADLTSLLASLTDRYRLKLELDTEGRSLASRTTFARLAEQLGRHLGEQVGADALRDANNAHTLDPKDTRVDRHGRPNYIAGIVPHELSLVMTGALYRVFRRLALDGKKRFAGGIPKSYASLDLGPAGLGAYLAAERVARMVVRALDHLPPGEASFADFGRAVLAADRFAHPEGEEAREWLAGELVDRKIVASRRDLAIETGPDGPAMDGASAETLLEDNRAARRFAQRNREFLRIPVGVPFTVGPRYMTTVRPSSEGVNAADPRRALVFRVAWQVSEENAAALDIAPLRSISCGSTLVMEWSSGGVRSLLTSDTGVVGRHATDRDRMVRWLSDEELLVPPEESVGPDGRRLRAPMVARSVRQSMRLTGGARMVHCLNFPWPSS